MFEDVLDSCSGYEQFKMAFANGVGEPDDRYDIRVDKFVHAIYNVSDMWKENKDLYEKFIKLFAEYMPDGLEMFDNMLADTDIPDKNLMLCFSNYLYKKAFARNYCGDHDKLYDAGLKDYMYISYDATYYLNIPNVTCTFRGYFNLLRMLLKDNISHKIALFSNIDYVTEYVDVPNSLVLHGPSGGTIEYIRQYIKTHKDYPKLAFISKVFLRSVVIYSDKSKIGKYNNTGNEKWSRLTKCYVLHKTGGDAQLKMETMFLDKTNVVDMINNENDDEDYYESVFEESIKQKNEYLMLCPSKSMNPNRINQCVVSNENLIWYYGEDKMDCGKDIEYIGFRPEINYYGEYKLLKRKLVRKIIKFRGEVEGVPYNSIFRDTRFNKASYDEEDLSSIYLEYMYAFMESLGYNSCECAKRNYVFINHDMDTNNDEIKSEIMETKYSMYCGGMTSGGFSTFSTENEAREFINKYAICEMTCNLYDHLMNAIVEE